MNFLHTQINSSVGAQSNMLWDTKNLSTAIRVAGYYAHRLTRTLGLSREDVNDISQDLLIKLFRRSKRFDPNKSSWATFTNMVIRNASSQITQRRFAELKRQAFSINDTRPGTDAPISDSLTVEDGIGAVWASSQDSFFLIEQMHDVERLIARLPNHLQKFCHLLMTKAPGAAQRHSGLSPAQFYRVLQDLRMRLRAEGLTDPNTP